jgi:signal peptidase II
LVLPAVAIFVVLVDQVSKYAVMTGLEVGQSWDIVPWLAPIFRLTYVANTGVAFGLFPGLSRLFAAVPAIAAVAILVYGWSLPSDQFLIRIVLGLPLGGAIGNLVDRVHRGFVVDFIDLSFWPLREWPIFNLADSSIVAGVVLLGLLMLWDWQIERVELQALKDG